MNTPCELIRIEVRNVVEWQLGKVQVFSDRSAEDIYIQSYDNMGQDDGVKRNRCLRQT